MAPVDGGAPAEAGMALAAAPAATAADAPATEAPAKPPLQPRAYQLELLELAKNRNVRRGGGTGE